jgi:hypothetical protein
MGDGAGGGGRGGRKGSKNLLLLSLTITLFVYPSIHLSIPPSCVYLVEEARVVRSQLLTTRKGVLGWECHERGREKREGEREREGERMREGGCGKSWVKKR